MIKHLLCVLCVTVSFVKCTPELKLLHVLFAHKSYAPFLDVLGVNGVDFPRNLTYEYFHSAATDMPNAGKLNMYNLGVHLREVYGKFLGSIYTDEIMKMRTSEYVLSIMAGQLVNAGLWPPVGMQKWSKEFNWQPTPADYVSKEEDTLLLGMHCPGFVSETDRVLNMQQMQRAISQYLPLFDLLSRSTGMKVERPSDVALLYASLETRADLNHTLPHWAHDVFPHGGMYNVTLLEYDVLTHTPLQRKLNGGTILKEVIGNSLKYIQGAIPKGRKIMLYSGDDRNIVGVLKSLNIWSPHIPNEAASIIFELYHDNDTNTHGLKVKYYTGTDGDTIPLEIPNCTVMCPLKLFLTMFFDALPKTEELLCNWKIPNEIENDILSDMRTESSSSISKTTVVLCLIMVAWSLHESL